MDILKALLHRLCISVILCVGLEGREEADEIVGLFFKGMSQNAFVLLKLHMGKCWNPI